MIIRIKIAIASLSYEPATEREIYPGTMPMNKAAQSPVPSPPLPSAFLPSSRPSRYVALQGEALACAPSIAYPDALSCQTTESRREHDTDVSNVYRKIEIVQDIVNDSRGHHYAWKRREVRFIRLFCSARLTRIHCASNDTSERVPCCLVEPARAALARKRFAFNSPSHQFQNS